MLLPPGLVVFVARLGPQATGEARRLDWSGYLLMSVSIASVLTLVIWCYRRLLFSPRPERPERDATP